MSRIVAIASGKGGVGKTWLAITLAQALAELGRRVLLFDGDLGLANVDVQLGLDGGSDLGAVLSGRARLAEVVRRLEPAGFDLIPGRSGSGSLAGLDRGSLEALLGDLRDLAGSYDDVVLDLAAGIEPTLLHLAGFADRLLVVVTEEPTALTDAYAFVKLHLRAGGRPPSIVVNLAEGRSAGHRTYEALRRACASFLRLSPELLGIVRRDTRVGDAIRGQSPHLVRHPNSPAAEDVRGLARQLCAP